ncbi:short-chain alcohol dehydrogenases/reductase [Fusarium heterosporum]|uniref:Short-chain alcohol dehydrogenases/reductase n=1 Tax=Fusarium heterosporum TaxID=42747 RepID=A0A8H5TKY0_FUSHE|nr:short-chain alcohol dehydrogenases/reductase [Fusarium heterosporum]
MSTPQGTVLVTGTNGGLGSAIVADIIKKTDLASNYVGVYTVRKAATATQLKKALSYAPASHKHDIVELDLSSLASVRTMAAEINRRVATRDIPPIRALILNAAYQDHEQLTMTEDEYETSWHVNFLANQLLALLLLQSMDKEKGRILIVGSWSHDVDDQRNMGCLKDVDSLFPGPEELAKGKWSKPGSGGGWLAGYRRYGASKLCAVMLMHELVNRLAHDPQLSHITAVGLDPGVMGTDLTRRGNALMYYGLKYIGPLLAPLVIKFNPNGDYRPSWKSAGDAIQLTFETEALPGKSLYLNGTDELETAKEAQDEVKRKALWAYGLEAAQIKQGDTILQDWQ